MERGGLTNVHDPFKLTLPAPRGVFGISGQSGPSVVERVDEETCKGKGSQLELGAKTNERKGLDSLDEAPAAAPDARFPAAHFQYPSDFLNPKRALK